MFKNIFVSLFCLIACHAVFSMENVGIIEDPFFKDPGTAVKIKHIFPHKDSVMVVVEGLKDKDTRLLSLSPFCSSTFIHNDEKHTSQEKLSLTVVCGDKLIAEAYMRDTLFPYVFLRDIEDKIGELTLEGSCTFYKMKEFQRKDGSILRECGEALYKLDLKQERRAIQDVKVCIREWTIISQWQKKKRHARNHYTAIDIYNVTTRTPILVITGDNALPVVIKEEFVRKELKFKLQESESPECGDNGKSLPNNSIIL